MKVIKRINPGKPGTKKYLEIFGEKLFCVRYRHNKESHERITTVELIVDKGAYYPEFNIARDYFQDNLEKQVYLKLGFDDKELRCRVIKAGGKWLQEKKFWKISYQEALKLGLKERIVK